jgi:hypothetical protein
LSQTEANGFVIVSFFKKKKKQKGKKGWTTNWGVKETKFKIYFGLFSFLSPRSFSGEKLGELR